LKKTYNTFVVNIDHGSKVSAKSLLESLKGNIAFKSIIFEQNTVDKKTNKKIPDNILRAEIDYLMMHKVVNISHYPDDYMANHPSLDMLKSTVSLHNFPLN